MEKNQFAASSCSPCCSCEEDTDFMMGHGVEGRYGGLPDEFSSLESSKIVILPVPFDMTTTYQQGANFGPQALIEASRNMELLDVETNSEVYKHGIYTAPAVEAESSEEMLQETYKKTLAFLKKGKMVVTLGGEHAISPAPIRAYAEVFGSISILQFDAHTDLVPAYDGNPLSHASAMARAREIKNVSHIVPVAIRSMSPDERKFLDPKNTFFAHDLHENDSWMDRVVDSLSEQVYITFDLDAFDSSVMPSTGTPEPGGLFWHQATKLLKKVAEKKKIVGFDVVELCPLPNLKAPDYLAAKLVYKILSYIFAKKGKK